MTPAECARVRELAPELALGIAEGDERAAALQHLAGSAACRHEVSDLAAAADATLLLAPSAEPPTGFETRALARFADLAAEPERDELGPDEPEAARIVAAVPRRRRRPALVALAAAAALLAVVGLAVGLAQRSDRSGTGPTAAAGWTDRSGALRTPGGTVVGRVTLDQGRESTLTVELADGAVVGHLRRPLRLRHRCPVPRGTLRAGPGATEPWSTSIGVPTYDLRRVRLVNTAGGPNLEAELPT